MDFSQMIHNGQFGMSSPMQQTENYNPYINYQQYNTIPINKYQQQCNQNGFTFQPINTQPQYYNPYTMPQQQYGYSDPYMMQQQYGYQNPYMMQQQYGYQNPYMMQQQYGYQNPYMMQQQYGYSQPKYDYYNPYGEQQYQYGYQNPYNGYQPYLSPMQRQKILNKQVELTKIKYRMVCKYYGKEVDEEKLDELVNPNNKVNIKTPEEIKNEEEVRYMQYLEYLSKQPQVDSQAQREARFLRQMSENYHKELDSHSLCQFFEEDLWKLQREEWIRNNISLNKSRNLSTMYNSNDYNELLNMHRSSNPYIGELLDNSRYDNNITDTEMGMDMALDRAKRRQSILEGKVPTFISSEETQKRRAEWTSQIMNQIYKKGATVPNV